MIRPLVLAGLVLSLLPLGSWASSPKVAVDIAPLHSIVAQVMHGIGEPELLIQPEASPHSYSLRPSEAEALAEAQVVFWISGELTPWLENSLENLANSANKVEMLKLSETVTHPFREGATFQAHSHAEEPGHHKHHDDHEGHQGHEGHHHGAHDPHAWLDPVNAKTWAAEIAHELSALDPSNEEIYQRNARAFAESMDDLMASLDNRARRLDGIRFIVFHDAYQYFERHFGLTAAGAISLSDASDPSPARIREIQRVIKKLGVTCAFSEPQYDPRLLNTVFSGSDVQTVGVLDPLGTDIEIGKDHYTELLKSLMASLEQCST